MKSGFNLNMKGYANKNLAYVIRKLTSYGKETINYDNIVVLIKFIK
mgnify:CR=1 FL=1